MIRGVRVVTRLLVRGVDRIPPRLVVSWNNKTTRGRNGEETEHEKAQQAGQTRSGAAPGGTEHSHFQMGWTASRPDEDEDDNEDRTQKERRLLRTNSSSMFKLRTVGEEQTMVSVANKLDPHPQLQVDSQEQLTSVCLAL